MICVQCAKRFNSGPAKYKKVEDDKKRSVMFCSEECQKSYG